MFNIYFINYKNIKINKQKENKIFFQRGNNLKILTLKKQYNSNKNITYKKISFLKAQNF